MTVSNYSTTASSNTSVNGINISEGMSPSDVNNAQRSILSDTRSVWNDKEWFLLGDADGTTTFTRASTTSVTVAANITSTHHVGRRVKIIGSNTGTIFGKISASAFSSPNTTLTFALDSGTINSGDSTVSVYVGSTFVGVAIPVIDEDAMGSDSAILPPSQQSVKAFVESGTSVLTNKRLNSPKINEDVVMSSTSTELNILDGVTSTTAELNILDGVTSTTAELNILDGVTSTAAELNILDGVTSTASELNILDGVTSTTAELNILDGVTSTTAELNYTDGVTSNIQTQLDAKLVKASNLSDLVSASTARSNLGLGTIATQASSSVSISGGSITGIGSPSSNTDVAIKSYVDQAVAGLRTRTIAECASTANVNIANALEAGDAIDGVTLVAGDRVLLKDQSTATENGLYIAVASGAGTASRDPEHDTIAELSGQMIVVNQGSANDNKIFLCTTDNTGSVGSTNITYTIVTPSNSGTVESVGITQSGSEFTIADSPVTSSGNITLNVNRISATKIGANTNISDTEFGYLNGVTSNIQTQLDATIPTSKIADDAVTLAKMAPGTDGNLISYDASGNPVAVATGNDGQVLTSTGAGSPPVFETLPSGVSLSGSTNNNVTTVTGANAIIGETNFTYNGTIIGAGANGASADLGVGIHVKESDSGAGVNGNADHVVIEANGNAGMSILTATGSAGKIAFGDSGDSEIGKILYDHSNNSMQVYTNANQAMNINTAGQVTKPLQAYFHVVPASEQVNIANGDTVVWGTEVKDIGGNFASNTFTAPVTGVYALNVILNVNGYPSSADYVWINIVTSNRTHKVFIQGTGLDADSYYSLGGLAIADMDASDTATITWEQSGGSATADVLASNSHFYGYLLG